ncbi:hypothetical protein [Microbacterium sp.]|uniref:hypothetical protein n=1 Tax=Microbacterium sp. TaxID=51671 RepID=UPI0025D9367E|nr:hypothetical protein [Microbacterium sp.]
MAKVPRIHSLPADSPWDGGLPPQGSSEHPRAIRALDRALQVQRPVVITHLRSIRLRNPNASTAEIARILERRYLATVTTGGAAVGATAVVPGIGTGVTLALGGVETIGFIEATALYAQSLAELHGIRIESPDRARALVLTLMLGEEGVELIAQLSGQLTGGAESRDRYWGKLVTTSLPRAAVGPLLDRLKPMFVRQYAAKGGASVIGKALPFGIGAAVGGAGNRVLGRRAIVSSHRAFGVPPQLYPAELEPHEGAAPCERVAAVGLVRAGSAVVAGGRRVTGSVTEAIGSAASTVARRAPRTGAAASALEGE